MGSLCNGSQQPEQLYFMTQKVNNSFSTSHSDSSTNQTSRRIGKPHLKVEATHEKIELPNSSRIMAKSQGKERTNNSSHMTTKSFEPYSPNIAYRQNIKEHSFTLMKMKLKCISQKEKTIEEKERELQLLESNPSFDRNKYSIIRDELTRSRIAIKKEKEQIQDKIHESKSFML